MKHVFENNSPCLAMQAMLLALIEIAAQRGMSSHKLLKGSRLFYEDLHHSNKQVSFQQVAQIFDNVHKHLRHDGVSFLLAQHWLFSQPNAAFQALLNCRNLFDMSRVLQVRQAQIWPLMFFQSYSSAHARHFVINPAIAQASESCMQFMSEFLVASIDQLCRWRFDMVSQITVKLPYIQPEHVEQYQAHLKLQYHFSQPCFMVSIPTSYLYRPQTLALTTMRGFYLQQSKYSANNVGFLQYVCSLLALNPKQSATELSERLGVSVATLKRKLKAHNTSLQVLKDQLQKQQAVIHISERGCSNEQVAQQLDYADVTNFRRNFKRWTGMTPSELRKLFN